MSIDRAQGCLLGQLARDALGSLVGFQPPEEKRAADAVMAELGVTPTEVIRMLYRQISLHRRLPFDVALPPETLTAMNDAKSGSTERLALDDLKAQLDTIC